MTDSGDVLVCTLCRSCIQNPWRKGHTVRTARIWAVTLFVLTALVVVPLSVNAYASGVTWFYMGQKNTSGIDGKVPNWIMYWGGFKTSGQNGGWGRHILVSPDPLHYSSSRRSALQSYYSATSYQYVPTTIHFDVENTNALHATLWYYTDLPNPERWSDDDDGDSRHEELNVRWAPLTSIFNKDDWVIEAEYWDALTGNVNQGASGIMNISQYVTTAIGKIPIERDWLWKYCFPAQNSGTWTAC